jgi:putative FmdB family regulatory protein
MPLYEYECDACGERFEVIQKSFSDPPPAACEKCGKGPVRRLMSSPAIQFKGSGFYITDYAKKGASEGGAGSKGKLDGGKTDSTSDSKADAKADAKTDSATPKENSAKSDTPAPSTSSESTSKKD